MDRELNNNHNLDKAFFALELFSGAGGFSIGMKNAGFNIVTSIEFNPQIAETYKLNNPDTILIIDDIRNIKATPSDEIIISSNSKSHNNIKELFDKKNVTCDIIFGGPPCQGFSMAGYRIRNDFHFFEDERNHLFKEFLRMVKYLTPKVFIIENVPGILNFNNGKVKEEIYETFSNLGYDIHANVLCAADYGVPQMRKRAFFIGNNMGIDSKELFPPSSHNRNNYVSVIDAIGDLPPLNSGEGAEEINYPQNIERTNYQKKLINPNGQIFNHVSSKHKEETIDVLKMIKEGQTMKDLPENMRTKSVHSGAYGRMVGNAPAYTLTTRLNTPSVGRITHPKQHRTITPREAARIQSFPDNYKFVGDITSIGMQIGNAVPPLLAENIGKHIMQFLKDKKYT